MLGTSIDTIEASEDRQMFADKLAEINEPAAISKTTNSVEGALEVAEEIGCVALLDLLPRVRVCDIRTSLAVTESVGSVELVSFPWGCQFEFCFSHFAFSSIRRKSFAVEDCAEAAETFFPNGHGLHVSFA